MAQTTRTLGLTENELVQALEAALNAGDSTDGALTVQELAEAAGISVAKVRSGLRILKAAGVIEVVKVQRVDLSDRLIRLPGYRLIRSPEHEQPAG